MKLIKKTIFGIFSVIVMLPSLVLAQVNLPGLRTASNLPGGQIMAIVATVMLWLLGIVGFIGIIGFAIAGILYLTSAGDDGKMETAKKAMIYSIIGVVVALMGYVMIQAINTMLMGNNPRF